MVGLAYFGTIPSSSEFWSYSVNYCSSLSNNSERSKITRAMQLLRIRDSESRPIHSTRKLRRPLSAVHVAQSRQRCEARLRGNESGAKITSRKDNDLDVATLVCRSYSVKGRLLGPPNKMSVAQGTGCVCAHNYRAHTPKLPERRFRFAL